MVNAVTKANRNFASESAKQVLMIYTIAAIVMWRMGWRRERIFKLFKLTQDVWNECADYGTEKSMLEIMEEETGIEIAIPGKKSYHEYAYLDASKWDGKPPTASQLIYIRQQQLTWLPAMIIACFGIALHRKYGWSDIRIGRFVNEVQIMRFGTKNEPKAFIKILEEETELTEADIKGATNDKK